MEYIFNKICNKLWKLDKILKYVEDGFIIYLKVIKLKNNAYLYVNLRSIYYSIFTLLLFLYLYFFEINIFSDIFIINYKKYLIIMVIYLVLKFFYLWTLFIYNWIFYSTIEHFINAWIFTLKIINFIFNITVLYFIFDLTIDNYLQCNLIFVLDSLFFWILNIYGRFFGYIFKVRRIDNFVNYPVVLLFIGLLLVFFDNKYRYIYFDYIKVYFQLIDEKFTNFK